MRKFLFIFLVCLRTIFMPKLNWKKSFLFVFGKIQVVLKVFAFSYCLVSFVLKGGGSELGIVWYELTWTICILMECLTTEVTSRFLPFILFVCFILIKSYYILIKLQSIVCNDYLWTCWRHYWIFELQINLQNDHQLTVIAYCLFVYF